VVLQVFSHRKWASEAFPLVWTRDREQMMVSRELSSHSEWPTSIIHLLALLNQVFLPTSKRDSLIDFPLASGCRSIFPCLYARSTGQECVPVLVFPPLRCFNHLRDRFCVLFLFMRARQHVKPAILIVAFRLSPVATFCFRSFTFEGVFLSHNINHGIAHDESTDLLT
jgi:hypothetical protein